MDSELFEQFLAEYRRTYGPIRNDAIAEALGISRFTLYRVKKRGGDKVLALACSALMHNLKRYGEK